MIYLLTILIFIILNNNTSIAQKIKETPNFSAKDINKIIEKNIFSPTRSYNKSNNQKKKIPTGEEEIKKNLMLLGTVKINNEIVALLQAKEHLKRKWNLSKNKIWIHKGDTIGSCLITNIMLDKIIIEKCIPQSIEITQKESRKLLPKTKIKTFKALKTFSGSKIENKKPTKTKEIKRPRSIKHKNPFLKLKKKK